MRQNIHTAFTLCFHTMKVNQHRRCQAKIELKLVFCLNVCYKFLVLFLLLINNLDVYTFFEI